MGWHCFQGRRAARENPSMPNVSDFSCAAIELDQKKQAVRGNGMVQGRLSRQRSRQYSSIRSQTAKAPHSGPPLSCRCVSGSRFRVVSAGLRRGHCHDLRGCRGVRARRKSARRRRRVVINQSGSPGKLSAPGKERSGINPGCTRFARLPGLHGR